MSVLVVVLSQIWICLVILGIFWLIERVILKLHSSSSIVSCDKEAAVVVFILNTLRLLGERIFQINNLCLLIFLIILDLLLLMDHFWHILLLFLGELLIDNILILIEN